MNEADLWECFTDGCVSDHRLSEILSFSTEYHNFLMVVVLVTKENENFMYKINERSLVDSVSEFYKRVYKK